MESVVKASREFQVFAKPAGPHCNLDCRYCYYLPKERLYPHTQSFRMPDDLLEAYIVGQIETAPEPEIRFFWHGGEPMILGLDYFRRIAEIQRRHRPGGGRITNSIQTNGVLLTDAWCRFFAAEDFSVGLSIDGPPEMHDAYRLTKDSRATHRQAMHGYRLLRQHRLPVDLLCVVHARNVGHPIEVYRFFKEIGVQYLSFIPLVEPEPESPGGVSGRTVPADAFGAFLCAIFDEWVRQDMGRIIVQSFEEAARPACGLDHSLCVFRPTCGDVPVVEHNGDFYSCDHFVTPEHRLGNIRETPLLELLESPAQGAFGRAKQESLPRWCRTCDVLKMCNGGCPKDRIIWTSDGEPGLNYLCAGYRRFFTHCRPYTAQMAALQWAGRPREELMDELRAAAASRVPKAGRNDPCPCG
ncbi:MAG: anaerobic sulfatase maturase, partial [Thermodesulfobacteriota bacterium]